MLNLYGRWRDMSLTCSRLLLSGRARGDSAHSPVVAHVVHRDVIHDDGLVVDIRNVGHVVHGSVVEKGSAIPISALIAEAAVAVTVVNAAVESNHRTPVALMKHKDAIRPAPIARRPEETGFGHEYPRTGHPEVTIVSVSPVSGRPNVALAGTKGLHIHRQRRRDRKSTRLNS